MNWTDSQANCDSLGSDLVEITTVEENTYIYDMSVNLEIGDKCVGLNDLLVEGSFVWPSGEPFVYHNFRSGNPDNTFDNEHCAAAQPDGFWNDKICFLLRYGFQCFYFI